MTRTQRALAFAAQPPENRFALAGLPYCS
jgi:hypothetical protein